MTKRLLSRDYFCQVEEEKKTVSRKSVRGKGIILLILIIGFGIKDCQAQIFSPTFVKTFRFTRFWSLMIRVNWLTGF